jgi:hypothetical protein
MMYAVLYIVNVLYGSRTWPPSMPDHHVPAMVYINGLWVKRERYDKKQSGSGCSCIEGGREGDAL